MAFETGNDVVIHFSMKESRPIGYGMGSKAQGCGILPQQLREHDVNRDHVRVQAVHSRAVRQVVSQPMNCPIPGAPKMICGKPPDIIQQVRPRDRRYPMPFDSRQIEIFNGLAIKVYLKTILNSTQPFDYAPLRAMLFIKERGDYGDARFLAAHHRDWGDAASSLG